MKSIRGGYPVVAEVFRVAVGGDYLLAGIKSLVHPCYVVALQEVVGVEYEVPLIAVNAVIPVNAFHKILKRKPLCPVVGILPLIA